VSVGGHCAPGFSENAADDIGHERPAVLPDQPFDPRVPQQTVD
jgi:hypothetical protein